MLSLLFLCLCVADGLAGVKVIRSIKYARTDNPQQQADLYMPDRPGKFPLIVFAHGGAWKSSDKSQYEQVGRYLAENDCVAIICNYRLAPRHRYPVPCEDFAKAVVWAYENGEKYNGDPHHLIAMGYSAGAQIASQVALNKSFLESEKYSPEIIKGVVGISGIYEINPVINRISNKAFEGSDFKDASPLHHVGKPGPRFMLLYAANDFKMVEKQTKQFYDRLKNNGYSVDIYLCKKVNHMTITEQLSDKQYAEEVLKFFREAVR